MGRKHVKKFKNRRRGVVDVENGQKIVKNERKWLKIDEKREWSEGERVRACRRAQRRSTVMYDALKHVVKP
jgi:23S rRNA maturation-related 3'-5' exoribonuclease YhaM